MASKPAPLATARTRSTEKTKQEKEAAARAAELASVAAQAAKQAAEEAASLAATQAVAAALAGVEARFASLEEAHRQQVDFIAAGGASGSFGAPSISAKEPPPFSPRARSTPPPPASPHPSDTAQAKRVLELEAALASSQQELASARGTIAEREAELATTRAALAQEVLARQSANSELLAASAAGVPAGTAPGTLHQRPRSEPLFPGATPLVSSIERGARLQKQSDQGLHVDCELLRRLECTSLISGYLERGEKNPESRNELEVLWVGVARLEDVLHRLDGELGSADICSRDGVYLALFDIHAMLNWRFKHVRKCFQVAAGGTRSGVTESSLKFDYKEERLKRISEVPDTAEEQAVEKQISLQVARLQASWQGRMRFGAQFGAAAAASASHAVFESGGSDGSSQPAAPAPAPAAPALRRGGK